MWIRQQDRDQIQPLLKKLQEQVEILQACMEAADQAEQTILDAARERALHIGCECITDIGNLIIDACIMRDPSSFTDIITVLCEERVFDEKLGKAILPIVAYRKSLAHDYLQLECGTTRTFASEAVRTFPECAEQISRFIQLEHPQ
ncbi:DUF86 domain-containing protein [Fodinisporobacter ferrooxydans]|uniref:DUF86 domain-containing protein n=1 Tax=Fodinisporobacter ferrooxydans TaxID=2901836 RepID=A0ABY4CJB9_9BACL|nr:DUF86 domain-containing protein [Alicyclobacillaceae bacterium MYW30-H2]